MRLAVRPPEYWPRLSYVALIRSVDVFVLADTYQYSRQSFQNRARLRTPDGWSWISVPLMGRQHGKPIRDTQINNRVAWMSKHRRAFQYNYGNTPYHAFFEDRINRIYDARWDELAVLTCTTVEMLCDLFGVKAEVVRASGLPGNPSTLPAIIEAIGPDKYVTPEPLYEREQNAFRWTMPFEYEEPSYRQHFEGFEPDMTSLDVLCNYGPEANRVIDEGMVAPRM